MVQSFSGRLVAAIMLVVVLVLGWSAGPAAAQGGERIERFEAVIEILDDGSVQFTELITYDFGDNFRRGIYRDIVTRQGYDSEFDREYPLTVIVVDADKDAPDQYELLDEDGGTRIRIGDPDVFITGTVTYEIRYRLDGTLNAFDEHDEFFWNVISDWGVPIDDARITVTAPAAITEVTCFAGYVGSSSGCAGISSGGVVAEFQDGNLAPYEAMTVVVGVPKGAVSETGPLLVELWSAKKAFSATPLTLTATGVIALFSAAGVGWVLYSRGRDLRAVGSEIDAGFASNDVDTERVPLRGGVDWPVEFVPPDDLRPGEVGVLVDEKVHEVDITATIIDLAVRGHLRIEEVGDADDHRLIRLPSTRELVGFEGLLLAELFGSSTEVLLSDLDESFASKYGRVKSAMYDHVVAEAWFDRRPDQVRGVWAALGVVALLASLALLFVAARYSHFALPAIPLVVGALVLLVGSAKMPRRTPKGHGLLQRTMGFRRFIDESEVHRARFAEQQHLFSEYLPYAVVFGVATKWADTFAGLNDGQVPSPDWYVGSRPFTPRAFVYSMNSFSSAAASSLTSVPPSTSGSSGGSGFSGGFSGGGGGGGGGGSW